MPLPLPLPLPLHVRPCSRKSDHPLALLLLLLDLQQQRAVDMRQHASEGDGGADQGVEFLVAANGELEMARRDALDFEVFGRVAG